MNERFSRGACPVAVIRRRRALPLFARHPWVFAGAIDRIETAGREPAAGDCVEVRSHEGEFIGWKLANPVSNIRIRLYSWDSDTGFGRDLLKQKLTAALRSHGQDFDLNKLGTVCRLVFSESDELSGLTVDFYTRFLLVQFTSLALYQYRDAILEILSRLIHPRGIWLRTEKGMREVEGLEVVDGFVCGEVPPRPLFIRERELQFGVDVQEGQKTGFYLDQRDNRRAVAQYIRQQCP